MIFRSKIAFLAVLLTLAFPAFAADKETAYERVMRTQTVRCGYINWPPLFSRDANTGVYSGIFHDYMNEAAARMNLKVEWTEEVTPANYIESLKAGRIDMLCSGDWPNASRGVYLDYTAPIFYIAMMPFARADDARFDVNRAAMGAETTTITAIDGEMSDIITRKDFSKAKTLPLPQSSDPTLMLTNVADGKADIAITDVATGTKFMAANPGKIKMVPLKRPLRVFANTLSMLQGNDRLRVMFTTATQEMLQSGVIDALLEKYEEHPGAFYRVAVPYEAAQ